MASAPFSTAALAHSQSPAGASSSGRTRADRVAASAPAVGTLILASALIMWTTESLRCDERRVKCFFSHQTQGQEGSLTPKIGLGRRLPNRKGAERYRSRPRSVSPLVSAIGDCGLLSEATLGKDTPAGFVPPRCLAVRAAEPSAPRLKIYLVFLVACSCSQKTSLLFGDG